MYKHDMAIKPQVARVNNNQGRLKLRLIFFVNSKGKNKMGAKIDLNKMS